MDELPRSVRIREVGPRDGFQNEPEVLATADKIRLISMLGSAGLRRIELTSFVRPDVIPQLADAEDVLDGYEKLDGVAYSVLIPNERGLDRALERRERFDEVNLFLSASETHNRKNVNRTVAESLAALERVIARALAEGLRCEGVISTSFGCPYEGHVPPSRPHGCSRSRSAWPGPGARRSRSATRPGWPTPGRSESSSPRRASDWRAWS
jgi:hydroxymethylglutaryl-CoA lyase